MTRIFKFIAIILVMIIAICGYSFFTDKKTWSTWSIEKVKRDTSEISWAKFQWCNDSIGGKYFERTAMLIPCKVDDFPCNVAFQFDLGANLSGVYENVVSSLYKKYPGLPNKFSRLRSPLQFCNNRKAFKDLNILFANYKVSNKLSYFYAGYGEKINLNTSTLNDTFKIGTIGADLFKDKILIIDYPNQQFAICDTVPALYNVNFTHIDLDKAGRVLLPMFIKQHVYKIMFDNGSSIFPLLVTEDKINNFSVLPDTDTIRILSWGKYHDLIGRPLPVSFTLAGRSFAKSKVYTDSRTQYRTDENDGITGNILFWNKTIIIDFKHKKFGIK